MYRSRGGGKDGEATFYNLGRRLWKEEGWEEEEGRGKTFGLEGSEGRINAGGSCGHVEAPHFLAKRLPQPLTLVVKLEIAAATRVGY